jgi:hypothetical protein
VGKIHPGRNEGRSRGKGELQVAQDDEEGQRETGARRVAGEEDLRRFDGRVGEEEEVRGETVVEGAREGVLRGEAVRGLFEREERSAC